MIIATHIGMQELEASRRCDVLQMVWLVRQDRGGSVQTKDQYIYIYMVNLLFCILASFHSIRMFLSIKALYAYGTYLGSLDKLKQEPNYEQVVGATEKAAESENDQTHLLLSSTTDSETKDDKAALASGEDSNGRVSGNGNGNGKRSREITPLVEGNQNIEEPIRKNTKHVQVADTSVWA